MNVVSSAIPLTTEEQLHFFVLNVSWDQFAYLERQDVRTLVSGKFRFGIRERTLVYSLWTRYKIHLHEENQLKKEGKIQDVKLSPQMCVVYRKLRLSRLQIAYCSKIDIDFLGEDLQLDDQECRRLDMLWTRLRSVVIPEAQLVAEGSLKKNPASIMPNIFSSLVRWFRRLTRRPRNNSAPTKQNKIVPVVSVPASDTCPTSPVITKKDAATVESASDGANTDASASLAVSTP